MRHIVIILSAVLTTLVWAASVSSQELSVSGNGSGSKNSITIQSGSSINVRQGNSIEVHNNVDAGANTGGNSISGNSGTGGVITGNATTEVNIQNLFNTNQTQIPCCITPTTTPAPGPQTTPDPTATPAPASEASSTTTTTTTGGGNGGSPSGGIGGGQVLGLPATGSVSTEIFKFGLYLGAALCLAGAKLIRVYSA